eukprot:549688-Pleurochrysis_carterae.AAC.1
MRLAKTSAGASAMRGVQSRVSHSAASAYVQKSGGGREGCVRVERESLSTQRMRNGRSVAARAASASKRESVVVRAIMRSCGRSCTFMIVRIWEDLEMEGCMAGELAAARACGGSDGETLMSLPCAPSRFLVEKRHGRERGVRTAMR